MQKNNEQNDKDLQISKPDTYDSPSYPIAFLDPEFMHSDTARSLRIQAEFMKPEMYLRHHHIRSTIIVFGSARIVDRAKAELRRNDAQKALDANPGDWELQEKRKKVDQQVNLSEYYELAREFSALVAQKSQQAIARKMGQPLDYVICTGGGPGIMEGGNRGAFEEGAESIGLNIKLPYEQHPNPYVSSHLCFQFHYFAMRKLHFLLRAKALVVFPGGFGTFDELFEALTLRQTRKMQQLPIVIFGREFWEKAINFPFLVDNGVIDREDLELFKYVETPKEAWSIIEHFDRH
ncbi:MAG: LOG family protein [Thermoguttaceae bacterium]